MKKKLIFIGYERLGFLNFVNEVGHRWDWRDGTKKSFDEIIDQAEYDIGGKVNFKSISVIEMEDK